MVLLTMTACATAPKPQPPNPIDKIINTPPFNHAVWGIDIEEEDGRVIYELNAHRLQMPASNRKLFAAAIASECLGLATRLKTELLIDGDDVIVKGDGDPSFGADRHQSTGFAPFVDALRATRVRDIVVDVSRFDAVTIVPSWEVGDLRTEDATPVDAVAFDENLIHDEAVIDSATNFGYQFRDALRSAGVAVDGAVRVTRTPRTGKLLATIESPMVAQLLMSVLKNSVNLYAEMLFKRSTPHGSYEEAQQLERWFLVNEVGIDPAEFFFADGSGLTRRNLVTPAASLKIVRWMNAPERRGAWWLILGEPGGEGTLSRRLLPLAGRLRAKTGTLTGVHTLSGVVRGANGRYRYFSIMINHHLAGEATRLIDQIVMEIAKF